MITNPFKGKFIVRDPVNWTIHELSKSVYDLWVQPPNMDSLSKIIAKDPKNYTNIDPNLISIFIFNSLIDKDPLFSKVSIEFRSLLLTMTNVSYVSPNILDLSQCGDGLIVPTFVEIFYKLFFTVEDSSKENFIKNDYDQQVYDKYFWTYEFKSRLIGKYLYKF